MCARNTCRSEVCERVPCKGGVCKSGVCDRVVHESSLGERVVWGSRSVCPRTVCEGLVRERSVFFQLWCKNVLCAKVSYLASGNLLQFAIENGPVEIVDFPIKHGDFP